MFCALAVLGLRGSFMEGILTLVSFLRASGFLCGKARVCWLGSILGEQRSFLLSQLAFDSRLCTVLAGWLSPSAIDQRAAAGWQHGLSCQFTWANAVTELFLTFCKTIKAVRINAHHGH